MTVTETDDVLEEIFGPPHGAAADLNELRVWGHGRTSLQPTAGSQAGRELCSRVDPTWPVRALTNERILLGEGQRPRGYGVYVKVAESTLEGMMSVASGRDPQSTKKRSSKLFETLWPAQSCSWQTWVMQTMDATEKGTSGMRRHHRSLGSPYVHPARFMAAVREGGTPYLDAVAARMELGRPMWKFGSILFYGDLWSMGLNGFQRDWLDLFPRGELAMWLRSSVCCGWFTSGQLAHYMGLETARSCEEGWI